MRRQSLILLGIIAAIAILVAACTANGWPEPIRTEGAAVLRETAAQVGSEPAGAYDAMHDDDHMDAMHDAMHDDGHMDDHHDGAHLDEMHDAMHAAMHDDGHMDAMHDDDHMDAMHAAMHDDGHMDAMHDDDHMDAMHDAMHAAMHDDGHMDGHHDGAHLDEMHDAMHAAMHDDGHMDGHHDGAHLDEMHDAMHDAMHDEDHMDAMHEGGHMMADHDVPENAAAIENPLPVSEEIRLAGAATFQQACAVCHGATGKGDGPAAAGLTFKPADLREDQVQGLSDGALFHIVTHGRPERGMPAWEEGLSEQQRWQLVHHLRALVQ